MMESNILFIVEGSKCEPNFFEQLAKMFDLKFEIYCLETNIYFLYKKMKEIDFNGDIKDILLEIHPEKQDILSKKFAYTYLIFDCDAHHSEKNEKLEIEKIILNKLDKLNEMSQYFVDETDPSIGKLYINYPMMESYRDCDDFFEEKYSLAQISINEIPYYKSRVALKKLCNKHINKYTKINFLLLILQNLYKLNYILSKSWQKPTYIEYLQYSNSTNILSQERNLVLKEKIISILNTSLFMITDYFGNKNKFYDNLIVNSLLIANK